MISFACDNLMIKKIINRQKNSNFIPKHWKHVYILDSNNEINCNSDINKALNEYGIFIVLACLIFPEFEQAKKITFKKNYPDEFCYEHIISTRKTKYNYLIPESRCPQYVSPDFFGVKVQIVDNKFEITYGGLFEDTYEINFDKGYEDIEIIYADEIQKSFEYPETTKFIPFNENDDELDKYSINNLVNPILIKFMYQELVISSKPYTE